MPIRSSGDPTVRRNTKPIQRKTWLKRSTKPLKRSRIRPISPKKRTRVGKLGIVRLVGTDMTDLRQQAYDRAKGMCEVELPHECPGRVRWEAGDLAHRRNRRMYGDVIENVWWACREGHRVVLHTYGKDGQKPCPKKPLGLDVAAGGEESCGVPAHNRRTSGERA